MSLSILLFTFWDFERSTMIIQRVLSLLDEKSLKAADLCRALDISTSTMTNWKNRGTDPPAKMIVPICEFLGVSCEFLLTGKEILPSPHNASAPIRQEASEWLVLIHQLPDDAQLEFKGELKGYIKCLKRDVGEPAGLREAK